jgi:hypothetical protein
MEYKLLVNEVNARTFVGLSVQDSGALRSLTRQVDQALRKFDLRTYHEVQCGADTVRYADLLIVFCGGYERRHRSSM